MVLYDIVLLNEHIHVYNTVPPIFKKSEINTPKIQVYGVHW